MNEKINLSGSKTPNISFWAAFWFWFKLGFISFGGPAGQIAIMHEELVERRKWISERRFLHALNYCMILPGPEAQQLATYIGWLMHRSIGGIVAGVLFVLPSLVILMTLSWLYIAFGHLTMVAGALYGVKSAVVVIVLHAAFRIGSRTLKNKPLWCIAIASFISLFAFNTPFPIIIMVAALIGYFGNRRFPDAFKNRSNHDSTLNTKESALIGDDTALTTYMQFGWIKLIRVVLIGLLLWFIPMFLLWFSLGWTHTYTQMAWFFTKAAFLTFGGAYAVLPYVYQGAVSHFGWLTPSQMMDGLALGETTPGPLIMVVAFVGFVGSYVQSSIGVHHPFIAGAIGAILVTWFTFLPSFIFILGGAPIVESTHNKQYFTAPLTAITAAIVGVIFNLAIFFGYHVFWPNGILSAFDTWSALLATCIAVALFRFKANVITVILISALAGLLITYIK